MAVVRFDYNCNFSEFASHSSLGFAFSVGNCCHLVFTQSPQLRLTSKVIQFSPNKSQVYKKPHTFTATVSRLGCRIMMATSLKPQKPHIEPNQKT